VIVAAFVNVILPASVNDPPFVINEFALKKLRFPVDPELRVNVLAAVFVIEGFVPVKAKFAGVENPKVPVISPEIVGVAVQAVGLIVKAPLPSKLKVGLLVTLPNVIAVVAADPAVMVDP
jgi:hypothetical protein